MTEHVFDWSSVDWKPVPSPRRKRNAAAAGVDVHGRDAVPLRGGVRAAGVGRVPGNHAAGRRGEEGAGSGGGPKRPTGAVAVSLKDSAAAADIVLSAEQARAVKLATSRKNVLFVGPAGSGKSLAMLKIVRALEDKGLVVQATAPTNAAAREIGGITINKFGGVCLATQRAAYYISNILNRDDKALLRWRTTDVLIIDEISMVSGELLDLLDTIGRALRTNQRHLPFGGIQVIGSGDMLQLKPVKAKFAFEGKCFYALFPMSSIVLFESQFRCKCPKLASVLADLREGKHSPETERLMNTCVGRQVPEDFPYEPVIFFPLRRQVAHYNDLMLSAIEEPDHKFKHRFSTTNYRSGHSKIGKAHAALLRDSRVDDVLVLREGAQVVFTRTIDDEIVTGTAGVVAGFHERTTLPLVDLPSGRRVHVYRQKWSTEDEVYTIKQVPLVLGWAQTAHASQGRTYRAARMCFDETVFGCNMAYMMASRLTSLHGDTEDDKRLGTVGGGLFIPKKIDFRCVVAHPKCLEFYRKLRLWKKQRERLAHARATRTKRTCNGPDVDDGAGGEAGAVWAIMDQCTKAATPAP